MELGIKSRDDAIEEALRKGSSNFIFRRERRRYIFNDLLNIVAGMTIIVLAWWAMAELVMVIKGAAFPTPPMTIDLLMNALIGSKINGATIYAHAEASLLRWGAGYLLALSLGIILGMIFGRLHRMHDVGMMSIYVLQMIPGLAWIPIAMLIFGLGEMATVFIIFITALSPIVINTAGGIRGIPPIYLRVAEMSGKDGWTTFTRVLVPSASLSMINGMRIGLANGWRVLIAAEMVVGLATGLGYSIYQSRYNLDFTAAFVCIMVICAIGLTIEKFLFVMLENRVRHRLGLDQEG